MTQAHPGSGPPDEAGPRAYRQVIRAGPGAAVYAVLDGNMHIRNGYPVYRFEPFSISPQSTAISQAVISQSEQLAGLSSWRDTPDPGISVQLIHGQGRSGVTAQFASDSSAKGWVVWAARYLSDPTEQTSVAPGDPGSALVVIVEDAGCWPADDLQLLLQNPLLRCPQRARVLLATRSVESWWPALRHRFSKAGIAIGGTLELQPIPPGMSSTLSSATPIIGPPRSRRRRPGPVRHVRVPAEGTGQLPPEARGSPAGRDSRSWSPRRPTMPIQFWK